MTVITHDAESLRLLACLLDYPREDTVLRCAELARQLPDELAGAAQAFEEFRSEAAARSAADLEELYASTFDVNPACCMYVGYHLFGESYKRGAFMAKLNAEYRTRDFNTGTELPDHLCVMLRFVAGAEDEGITRWLIDETIAPALRKIVKAFDGSDNIYGTLLRAALLTLESADQADRKPAARTLPVLDTLEPPFEGWEP